MTAHRHDAAGGLSHEQGIVPCVAEQAPARPAATDQPSRTESVPVKLQALQRMDSGKLRAEWRRLYRTQPPRRATRDLLMLAVAWKIQEAAHGGLSAATRRRLANLTDSLDRTGDIGRSRIATLRPGARLLREWGGKTHTVTVLEKGFDWNGEVWRSLSAIARKITGSRWSGPRFFGIIARARSAGEGREDIDA